MIPELTPAALACLQNLLRGPVRVGNLFGRPGTATAHPQVARRLVDAGLAVYEMRDEKKYLHITEKGSFLRIDEFSLTGKI